MNDLFNFNSAAFSDCRKYRYALWRWWDKSKKYVMFIGLNPSTADEIENDPTIRRCIGFAQSWGFGGLCMANLFAIRATNPKIMLNHSNPIGIDNNEWLIKLAVQASKVIAAWGMYGGYKKRDKEIIALIPDMYCLGITKEGFPKHPLYLKKDSELTVFSKGLK